MIITIAERLKLARENAELKQLDVMNLTENRINNKTLSGYESGRSEPDFDTLNKLCDLYNVSVDWILGRTKIKNVYKELSSPNIELIDDSFISANVLLNGRELSKQDKEKLLNVMRVVMDNFRN